MIKNYKGTSFDTMYEAIGDAWTTIKAEAENYGVSAGVKKLTKDGDNYIQSSMLTSEEIVAEIAANSSDQIYSVYPKYARGTKGHRVRGGDQLKVYVEQAHNTYNEWRKAFVISIEGVLDDSGNKSTVNLKWNIAENESGDDSDQLTFAAAFAEDQMADQMRLVRNAILAKSDGEMAKIIDEASSWDELVTRRADLKEYRTLLRDLPEQEEWPLILENDFPLDPTIQKMVPGLVFRVFKGYTTAYSKLFFEEGSGANATDFSSIDSEQTTVRYFGYFKPTEAGDYTVEITKSDDFMAVWIDEYDYTHEAATAIKGYSVENSSKTKKLKADKYYTIAMMYSNENGPGHGDFVIKKDGVALTNRSDYFFVKENVE